MTEREQLEIDSRGITPVHDDGFFIVRQALNSSVPGMYSVEPSEYTETIANLDDKSLERLTNIQRQLRMVLKTKFDVAVCGLYVEEHPGKRLISYTIPFHIDRLSERFSVDVYQPYIEEYIKSYTYSVTGETIKDFNSGISGVLESELQDRDTDLVGSSDTNAHPVSGKSLTTEEIKEQKIEQVLEVFEENELPVAPSGKKYYVCIGGSKNFQCFLSDNSMSKGEFIFAHENEIDDCLKPVYADDNVVVRQDAKYAIPGFYIVSPRDHFRRIDETPRDVFEKCMFMVREVRQGLLNLGIEQAHIYHDEKYKNPASVHFWILPIYEEFVERNGINPTIFSKDIWRYLESFPKFSSNKPQIMDFNNKMRSYLNSKTPGSDETGV